ncbi:MAG: lysine biosynthesis protein LysW [Ktedonobacteraceae bacterium]
MSCCPECATHIHVTGEIEVGKIVLCPDCQIPLEVVCQEPVELMLAAELVDGNWAD